MGKNEKKWTTDHGDYGLRGSKISTGKRQDKTLREGARLGKVPGELLPLQSTVNNNLSAKAWRLSNRRDRGWKP